MKYCRPLLITAHPGHELLLHRWLELQDRATVLALTDGSGHTTAGRAERSRAVIAAAGASPGAVFGLHADRFWYDAILKKDAGPFRAAIGRIVAAVTHEVPLIVVDPVEHFNPMHDLTAVVGHRVGEALVRDGRRPRFATYAIEKPGYGETIAEITLDAEAQLRKVAAVDGYFELAEEAQRVKSGSSHLELARERLYAVNVPGAFPEQLAEPAHYEQVGRARQQAGTYSQVITYADHVRPLALQLLGETHEDSLL